MDKTKITKWAEQLLDTGKRNNLINFHDTKTSYAEVVLPDIDTLFEKIDGVVSLEVFDPKLKEDEDEEEVLSEENALSTEVKMPRQAYIDRYAQRIRKQNQILVYSNGNNPIKSIRVIDKKAKTHLEETGVNVSYLAFGFINWKESENSEMMFRAPVLLVPIVFEHESEISPYIIKTTGEDVEVNPTFGYKLEAEYGIKLPEYEDQTLEEYLNLIESLVWKLKWTVTRECKIGVFSFLKINMYHDLVDNEDKILQNDNVRALLGEQVSDAFMFSMESEGSHVENPLVDLHNVVDADSSQIEAIEMAKSGKSFVLQGPPGTGKSQTITNIIAELLHDDKKVLFVSEKQAALNVVFDKLKKSGLEDFCLELHSYKTNKKTVIAELNRVLKKSKTNISREAFEQIDEKKKAQEKLDEYSKELHKKRDVIGKSVYQLYSLYSKCRDAGDIDITIPNIREKNLEYLNIATDYLKQYVEYVSSIGADYRKNPWYGFAMENATYQTNIDVRNALQELNPNLNRLYGKLVELNTRYNMNCFTFTEAKAWYYYLSVLGNSAFLTPSVLKSKELSRVMSIVQLLKTYSDMIHMIEKEAGNNYDKDIFKINAEVYEKRLTKEFTSAFGRLFNKEYKTIIKEIRMCRKDGKKPSYEEAKKISGWISLYNDNKKKFYETNRSVKEYFGAGYKNLATDWDKLIAELELVKNIIGTNDVLGNMSDMSVNEFAAEQPKLKEYATSIADIVEKTADKLKYVADCFDKKTVDLYEMPCSALLEKMTGCEQNIDMLGNWCVFSGLFSKIQAHGIGGFIDITIDKNVEPGKVVNLYKRSFYRQWIDYIIYNTPILTKFNRIEQDNAVKTFAEKDKTQLDISKAQIRSVLSMKRPDTSVMAQGSAVAMIMREGEKKRKQKSVRSLMQEAGELIQILKPCFLMSPLSVSSYLGKSDVTFDTVVFDEASQIFPEDAIGAIYRGKQVIVVGDSRQMPPSNFFNTSSDNDYEDEESGDIKDFESILDICSTAYPQLRLKWHYRSKYEQLIQFSNSNFYDGELITFPSSKTDTKGVGVDYYYVDSTFNRKSHSNRKEAEFVVDLIYENIEKYPDRSLGVVAFSISQQSLIEHLLSKRRLANPEKEEFFRSDAKEPFFVKNLETVQGDERDTIIFSIAYGKDESGRILYNFGPLNRAGGERRLNVAVTRAKVNVQLVSTMHATDIDLSRTSSVGVKLLREYLDFAENGVIAINRAIDVNEFETYDSEFEMEVHDFLEENGYSVDTQVGCSGFKIDLALKRPDSSDYVLAIECDGATYHSSKNARDRDRLRQEILENMGWTFYRIWSTDWFRNKVVEKKRLLAEVEKVTNAAPGVKNTNFVKKPDVKERVKAFESAAPEKKMQFPRYVTVDAESLLVKYPNDFVTRIRILMLTEAPLSEEWLLKRICSWIGREKVTSVVKDYYARNMKNCILNGIERRDGFLYLTDKKTFTFRVPFDSKNGRRDIENIAIEELAEGMIAIIKQNVKVEKAGLYKTITELCGFSRVTEQMVARYDKVIKYLGDRIEVEGELVSLK